MEKKSVLGIGILLLILVAISAIGYQLFLNKNLPKSEIQRITEDNFIFEYQNKGEGRWEYTVKGELPNPCYTIKTESQVMESYPEQVNVISTITKPTDDQICIQVIQEVNEKGEFLASENAKISFLIVEK